MQDREELFNLMRRVIANSPAEQTEIYLLKDCFSQARIANSEITENVMRGCGKALIRTVTDGKQGYVSVNSLKLQDLRYGLEKCIELARFKTGGEHMVTFNAPQEFMIQDAVDAKTLTHSAEEKAEAIREIAALAAKEKCLVAGTFKTNLRQTAVMNSKGLAAYFPETLASLNLIAFDNDTSGFSQSTSRNIADIDYRNVIMQAVNKCGHTSAGNIEPGQYTVILEPEAVADLLFFLGMFTFNAEVVQDGLSYVEGKFGEKIAGGNISIWDDAYDSNGLIMPFDAEGTCKQRVDLIKNGVANAIVYDSLRAAREEKESTGHSLLPNSDIACMPLNLFMQGGKSSLEEMVASTEFGVYITRFHYTNVVDSKKAVITGMTRDGTFLIRNGKIAGSINNLRFVQSIIDAFSNVEELTQKRQLCYDGQLCCVVPGLKLNKFNFTG